MQDKIIHQTSEDTLALQEVDWPKALEFLEDELSDEERKLLGESQRNNKNAWHTIFHHGVRKTIEEILEDSEKIKEEAGGACQL